MSTPARDSRGRFLPSKKTPKKPVPKQPLKTKAKRASTYLVTYAQNATPVHEGFLRSLENYAEVIGAEIIVIPGRYKNPTSIWTSHMEHDEWWDEALHPYLFHGRMMLGEHIAVFGDVSIQPTAVRPLTGFEVFVGKYSAIFGHPKIQLKTVATAERESPRILTTTGAVTRPNYTDSKAGKKGHAHHVHGACIVEQDEHGLFHLRQINALDDGSFIDLNLEATPDGVQVAPYALALVCGDIHVAHPDSRVLEATFAEGSIHETVIPEYVVYHDVLDFDVRNHHTINSFTDRFDRRRDEVADDVRIEVQQAVKFLNDTPHPSDVVVVSSNHDEAFDRWLNTADPQVDPTNALFFYETWAEKLRIRTEEGRWIPAFQMWFEKWSDLDNRERTRFLGRNESMQIGDIYVNFHGDKGPNGVKGSLQAFTHLGVKTITGHVHTPGILDGAYCVGVTGSLDQGYNVNPSSWMHSHCIIYANGKRSLVNILKVDETTASWRLKR